MHLEINGEKSIKDFETFLKKAKKLAESPTKSPTKSSTKSPKKSPKRLNKASVKKDIREYKTYKEKMYLDLVNKSKIVIIDLITYLKKRKVPAFVIVDYVLMHEDTSLEKTKDPLKSYELIIEGLEHMVLNPPEDD